MQEHFEEKAERMNRRNQQDAAVLIPEVKTDDGIEIILEQRALSLLHQPGEWCLPGCSPDMRSPSQRRRWSGSSEYRRPSWRATGIIADAYRKHMKEVRVKETMISSVFL